MKTDTSKEEMATSIFRTYCTYIFCKKLLLKISHNSQSLNCALVLFVGYDPENLIIKKKKDFSTSTFLGILLPLEVLPEYHIIKTPIFFSHHQVHILIEKHKIYA